MLFGMQQPASSSTSLGIEGPYRRAADGDRAALSEAITAVYEELRTMARAAARRSRTGLLQPTALVHETYLRLQAQRTGGWSDERSFLAVAARVMRRVLVDVARSLDRRSRGGGRVHEPFEEALVAVASLELPLLELNDAMSRLEAIAPLQSQIAELVVFGGLSIERTADLLGISTRTVDRRWRLARAWLVREIEGHGADSA
jgi:RNA polymerase sigma factor (TIGR02999 family)